MRMSGTTQMQPGLITRRSLPFGEGGLAFPQTAAKAARYTTFLIDRAYQLEIDLTLCRINETAISNRRWIAFSVFRFSSSIFTTLHVDTSAFRRLTCLPGEISCSQETRR